MSDGSSPASASAACAARAPKCEAGTPFSAMRRSRMPVRSRIHWSLVSTIRSRSALVRRRSGKAMPTPVMPTAGSDCSVMSCPLL